MNKVRAKRVNEAEVAAKDKKDDKNQAENGAVSHLPAFAKVRAILPMQQLQRLNVVIVYHKPWMNNFVVALLAKKYVQVKYQLY